MQLLQQDTSGAYRAELAQLSKEVENQREELYDDLVDKQVEALEKEIEKRHELYDKEVAALEERLAYMQENAILLWEVVNGIIAEGSEAMMATLENTISYINSNELSKEQQRRSWENNIQKTVETVTNDTVRNWGAIAKVLGVIAEETYPNYKEEAEDYTEVLTEVSSAVSLYGNAIMDGTANLTNVMDTLVNSLSTEMDNYIKQWALATSNLTGNVEAYGKAVTDMIDSLSTNINTLNGWNEGLSTSGGKVIKTIEYYDEKLADKYSEIYQDYIDERNRYQGELDDLIQDIQDEISSAIEYAAEAIRKAADSITASSGSGSGSDGGNNSGGNNSGGNNGGGTGSGGQQEDKSWRLRYWVNGEAHYSQPGSKQEITELYSALSQGELTDTKPNNSLGVIWYLWKLRNGSDIGQFGFKQGGLADFTGPAWLDGTPSKPEAVLNPKQTKLFESMVSSLEKSSFNSSSLGSPFGYNIGDIITNIQVDKLDNQTDINRLAKQIEDKIVKDVRNRVSISVSKGV